MTAAKDVPPSTGLTSDEARTPVGEVRPKRNARHGSCIRCAGR